MLSKKFEGEYSRFNNEADLAEDDRIIILVDLETIVSSLNYQLTQVELRTTKLETLLTEEQIGDIIGQNAAYAGKVFEAKSKLSSVKEIQKNRISSQNKAKLPNITIPKFIPKPKNMYSDFQIFKASFESIFLDSNLYTSVQLFNYLVSFLGGEAKDLCSRYAITQNFSGAYKELVDVYDRPQLLIQESIEHLSRLERPNSNVSALRNLYLKQNPLVSLLLKFIGDSITVDEALLLNTLLSKIPYRMDK